jgi:hypothetical protein
MSGPEFDSLRVGDLLSYKEMYDEGQGTCLVLQIYKVKNITLIDVLWLSSKHLGKQPIEKGFSFSFLSSTYWKKLS